MKLQVTVSYETTVDVDDDGFTRNEVVEQIRQTLREDPTFYADLPAAAWTVDVNPVEM